MIWQAATPQEYLDGLDKDWRRETLKDLRAIILSTAPHLTEAIHYKVLGYAHGDRYLFHLNAQKDYVSLYVGDISRIDPSGRLLNGISCGKGCIRFKKTTRVHETRIDEFIARAISLHETGAELAC
jgi:uncharacterized protein YdhG (YjbR/CyaY superfamily)